MLTIHFIANKPKDQKPKDKINRAKKSKRQTNKTKTKIQNKYN